MVADSQALAEEAKSRYDKAVFKVLDLVSRHDLPLTLLQNFMCFCILCID